MKRIKYSELNPTLLTLKRYAKALGLELELQLVKPTKKVNFK